MKTISFPLAALIIAAFITTTGCTKTETRVDQFWGTSYNLAKYNQIADLEAPIDNEPLTGVDGAVSTKVMNTYIKSFEKQEQKAKTYTIDLGSGK